MLNALRRGAKGVLAKTLIGLLVLSFAVWGISDFVNQIDPSEVAEAGDTPVPAAEFARVYQRAVGLTSQRIGQPLSPDQAQAIGLPSQVLSQLVTEALQVDAARSLGLDIGDETLAQRIREDPVFAGSDGAFERARFDRLLSQGRYSEAEYIELERDDAVREMLVMSLLDGLDVPGPYLAAYNRVQNQTRQVSYFVLDEDAIGPIADPTEATLRSFYEGRKADFRAPEYREIATVSLTAEAIAEPAAVSADAVRRAYEVAGAYGAAERRRVEQILMQDAATARRAAERLREGAALDTVLDEVGRSRDDIVDLGMVERGELVDPAVAEAAFSLDGVGAVAVDGRFGPALVRVTEVEAAGKRPFEEVEPQIRRELALEEAEEEVNTLFDRVEDAVAGGARVREIAERFSLPSRTVPAIDRDGATPEGGQPDPPVPAAALRAAFEGEEGDDAVPVEVGEGYTWVQVNDVTPAADRPYEAVAGEVLVAWLEAEKADRLSSLAEEALRALRDGAAVETVAERYGAQAQVSEPFSRGEPSSQLGESAQEAAFQGPEGHTAAVSDGEGRRIVLKVTQVSEPVFFEGDAALRGARSALAEGLADTLLTEFVNAWQAEVGATVNQPVLDQIIGVGDGRT